MGNKSSPIMTFRVPSAVPAVSSAASGGGSSYQEVNAGQPRAVLLADIGTGRQLSLIQCGFPATGCRYNGIRTALALEV